MKLTIYRVYYLNETIHEGDYETHHTDEEVHDNIHAAEAARLLEREGLSFKATGNTWAADPDGSYTVNYATGMECQTSGHITDCPDRLLDAIMRKVG